MNALTSSVFSADGTKLNVSVPMAPKKQEVSTELVWKGGYHDDKLFVSGIPNVITKTDVLCAFAEYGDAEVQLKNNTAIVSYGDKRDAARALRCLHKRFSFPGTKRHIYVRFAQKLPNNATSAKIQPKQKLTMVAWSLNFAQCFTHSI